MDWYLNKKVVITGGSSGIGKAAAILCARFGANVCILSRDESRCKAALGEIQQHAKKQDQTIFYCAVDVSKREQVRKNTPEIVKNRPFAQLRGHFLARVFSYHTRRRLGLHYTDRLHGHGQYCPEFSSLFQGAETRIDRQHLLRAGIHGPVRIRGVFSGKVRDRRVFRMSQDGPDALEH